MSDSPERISPTSYFFQELAYKILLIALKAVLVAICWNFAIPQLFDLPSITVAQSFVLITLIMLLFSNMDGYSKYQTNHLYELKNYY